MPDVTITAGDFDRLGRAAALAWGGARTALGVVALLDPPRVARPWIGDDADRVGALVFARALGGRDVALGVGTMVAAARGEPVRLWALTAAAADLGDVLITATHAKALPRGHRAFIATLAAGSALLGTAVALTERPTP
ncbi:hypothetical protein EHYA_07698 [Embleya hyalina]|uniref:DUF4267 domain-containing protein n=1 Tax=Embleya hyalina TaxID=516124 RepID=A0A401YZA9_9ACTN|nr:hypothetical protein EHYA_07698 [Embleya hyalina]